MSATSCHWVVFDYEVWMLKELRMLLGEGNDTSTGLSKHVQNAIVESALLHVRVLSDILLSRKKEPDEIRLKELLPGFQAPALEQLNDAYGSCTRGPCEILNKRLAHATDVRREAFD